MVVGGGIVGMAVAHRLIVDRPGAEVTVLEKERRLAAHQTGHNSGVIHAGVYYPPDSLKARLCRAGSRSMVDFCRTYGVPVDVCGKLIVATAEAELPGLRALHERARAGGLPVRLISGAEAREYEPHVACRAALHVPSTGVVDFAAVTDCLAALARQAGARIMLGARVTGVVERGGALVTQTTTGEVASDVLINCAGLHADRVAQLAGVQTPVRIVPFRGEYFALREDRRDLVRGLIYPVPDPALPFLGVHLTRAVDGSVHAGPNAVLALAREATRVTDPTAGPRPTMAPGPRVVAARPSRRPTFPDPGGTPCPTARPSAGPDHRPAGRDPPARRAAAPPRPRPGRPRGRWGRWGRRASPRDGPTRPAASPPRAARRPGAARPGGWRGWRWWPSASSSPWASSSSAPARAPGARRPVADGRLVARGRRRTIDQCPAGAAADHDHAAAPDDGTPRASGAGAADAGQSGPHLYLSLEHDGDPVTWDPCDPIRFVVNDRLAPL